MEGAPSAASHTKYLPAYRRGPGGGPGEGISSRPLEPRFPARWAPARGCGQSFWGAGGTPRCSSVGACCSRPRRAEQGLQVQGPQGESGRRNPEPGCRWWSRGGPHLRHRDSGCSRWSPGPEHSQLMANDVRPWALSRLPVASQESPNDRFAALSAPLERVMASALAKRNSPPPACAEQE